MLLKVCGSETVLDGMCGQFPVLEKTFIDANGRVSSDDFLCEAFLLPHA